ncbi:MAG: hypothetical protein P8188_14380 [Gemmatimonadota bacterium]|jgi:hypothetical protein
MALLGAAALTVLLNVPFGWWREGTRKFSGPWFLAVHGAVPLVILLRRGLGISLAWKTLPLLVLSYFAGQAAGAGLRRSRSGPKREPESSM